MSDTITAREFLNNTFNVDWMTSEEVGTIVTAMELYAKGKCREQRILCAEIIEKTPLQRKSSIDVELEYKILNAPEPQL